MRKKREEMTHAGMHRHTLIQGCTAREGGAEGSVQATSMLARTQRHIHTHARSEENNQKGSAVQHFHLLLILLLALVERELFLCRLWDKFPPHTHTGGGGGRRSVAKQKRRRGGDNNNSDTLLEKGGSQGEKERKVNL